MLLFSARGSRSRVLHLALAGVAGCGGSAAAPPAASAPAAAASPSEGSAVPDSPAPGESSATQPGGPAAADGGAYDIVKGRDPINLKPLFDKGALPAFPSPKVTEEECWRTTGVVGSSRQDYETLIDKCGAATGSVQYVKPTIGHLHHKHQRRDVFVVPVLGGLCYRVFGVGDATINDLDILIEQRGALVGDDKTTGPVAIIESNKAWCMDHDGTYSFLVQTHGEGHGQYVFGIWARQGAK
jgi:hypothetical protein